MNLFLLCIILVALSFIALINVLLWGCLLQTLKQPFLDHGFTFLGWPFRDLRSQ